MESAAFGDAETAYTDVNGHGEDFLANTQQTHDASGELFVLNCPDADILDNRIAYIFCCNL